jgi:hypothetical protein
MMIVSDLREEFHLIPTIPLYWDASLRNDSVGLYPSLRMRDATLIPLMRDASLKIEVSDQREEFHLIPST